MAETSKLQTLDFGDELPSLNFSEDKLPTLEFDEDKLPPLEFKETELPELGFEEPEKENASVLRQAVEPIKRIPEIYKREVTEGLEQLKQPGLFNKIIGGLRYTGSPITAPVEALIGEPTEKEGKALGLPETVTTFAKGMVEGVAYMWSPSSFAKKQMTKIPSVAKQVKQQIKSAKNENGLKAMEFIKDRRANIDKATLDSEKFIITHIENKLTKLEREALPFIRQGMKNTDVLKKIGKENLIDIIKNPSKNLLKASKRVGQYYDESFEFLNKYGGDVNYIEDYVTQIWDIPKNRKSEVLNYFSTNNPFTKKRKIPTLEEGIKLGLTPKTTDTAKLLRIYDQFKIKTAFNLKFADSINEMVDSVGQKLILPSGKAPDTWVQIDHPALRRTVFKGKKGDKLFLEKAPVSVHPDIAKEMKIIFDAPMSNGAIRAIEIVNAFTKKAMLTGSFFHHLALTESALSSGVGRTAFAMWNPKKIYNALKNKDFDIYKEMPLAKDAIDNGVSFGPLSDVQLSKVNKAFQAAENNTKKVPLVGRGVKLARKANDLWDRALWDYYHNNLKLAAYESQVAKELKRLKPTTPEAISKIKKQVGSFVNDSFGGQQWETNKVFGTPQMQQMMQWVLLAPDWTISTLKQAAAPVTGAVKGNKSQMVTGAKFWARAALYNTIIAQSVNYNTTKKITGEGKFTWENDPGHETHIFAGYNDDGTKKYLRTGKQFREAVEWVMKPGVKLGGKLSPVLREVIRQTGGTDPGSMFPTEWNEDEGWAVGKRLKSIAEMPVPFSLKPYLEEGSAKTFMFTLPASKGMTNYKTVKLFKNAIKNKDGERIARIYVSAVENGLDGTSLFSRSAASLKADETMADKLVANKIIKEMDGLEPQAQKDLIGLYRQNGVLNSSVAKQMNKIMTREQRIKQQQLLLRK